MVRCKVLHIGFSGKRIAPYCRSIFATIESIIHATRVREYLKKGDYRKAQKLMDMIQYYGNLVHRVAPGSKEAKILHDLIMHIKNRVHLI